LYFCGHGAANEERELGVRIFGQHPRHIQTAALAEMVALWIRNETDAPAERERLLAEHTEFARKLATDGQYH
jgi:hypothetical protein